ncbi:Hsp20/alpha crystallin family protein [Larkinella bovis]|uniref:Hsp20/alpha crystallin family protein n=1 Tax=Larkinella bovis TaxID=683041 RepID=A0ABW0IG70_9BACT
MPENVEEDSIQANDTDGILKIDLMKNARDGTETNAGWIGNQIVKTAESFSPLFG